MTRTREAASAGSKRGHRRRLIRQSIRNAYVLRMVENGGPELTGLHDDAEIYRAIAKWVADNLPDDVIDAIEARDAAPEA